MRLNDNFVAALIIWMNSIAVLSNISSRLQSLVIEMYLFQVIESPVVFLVNELALI